MLARFWGWLWPKSVLDLVLLAVFAGVYIGSQSYPPDARLFPTIVSALGAVLIVVVMATERISQRGGGTRSDVAPVARDQYPRLTLALLSAPVYCLLVWLTGFYVSTLATLVIFPILMGYRRILVVIPVALGVLVAIWLVFSVAMEMELPLGLLGKWYLSTFVHDR